MHHSYEHPKILASNRSSRWQRAPQWLGALSNSNERPNKLCIRVIVSDLWWRLQVQTRKWMTATSSRLADDADSVMGRLDALTR
jgi:hypothetical protein